jgi:spore germination protein YaaH
MSEVEEVETTVKEDTQPGAPVEPPPFSRTDEDTGEHIPQQPRQRSGGCGCWLPGILTALVVAVLVFVGLILPPVNLLQKLLGVSLFGPSYTMLTAQSNAVRTTDGGLTLVVDPADAGQDFGVALDGVNLNDFVAGSAAAGAWVPDALAAVPPNLALQSNVYTLEATGKAPASVALNFTIPQTVGSTDILDVYVYDANNDEWRFVPSHVTAPGVVTATVKSAQGRVGLFQAAPLGQPTVLASVDAVQVLSSDVGQLATIVSPAGLTPTLDGKLTGSLAPGYDAMAGYLIMPVIRNFADPRALDANTVTAILSNRALWTQHVEQITVFASGNQFAGVVIDYRDIPPEQRDNFSAFITALGASFDRSGLLLGVVVPTAQNVDGSWDTGAYDWRAIGAASDYVQINLGLDPSTFAPGGDRLVESMLRWTVGEVSRYKILLGLSALSVRQVGSDYTTVGYQDALAGLGNVTINAQTSEGGTIIPGAEITAKLDGVSAVSGTDTVIQSPFIEYLGQDNNPVSRIWLTTPDALRFRMDATIPFGLGGVAFTDLLADGVAGGVLQSILNYKLQLPAAPTQAELALRWRIQGANGVVSEVTTNLGDPLVATIQAPDGNYAINVDVVGGSVDSPRSGAAVALFAPTLTPTPLPTATPTPTPTPTPPPVVVQPQATAQQAISQAPAGAPGAGSIATGGFEYGGHVTSTNSEAAAAAMRRAGMNWMKIQIRYTNGMTPAVASGPIGEAHARGFKVLLAIPGVPGELAAGGAGYIQQFASFLGGVAALGPDAIEVWNEQNLDREWPRDQISAQTFTDMLRQSYAAIKGANGGVMVISGAMAPTGAEGAFPGQVVNDDRFLREMVAAGAMQYMDCLGAHYNEGITSPMQNGGDPRDNYYTRYLRGMIDTYWNISGGQRPICFTELGFLSSEGYGPLPDFFAWASGVSVAQQAAWLAESAAISSQSGKVRLMIVWNVDFSVYNSDPQGGYAMIRPGGACPACDALAGAR